jgi:stearoyl-CoA desaturase (delta-9 desaturase)
MSPLTSGVITLWATYTWAQIGWAVLAGLALCELNLFLTTAVLHRGLCHGAIRYPAWLKRAVAIWLWATDCIPPLTWIAAHLHHHAHSDTRHDPHAPACKGFWRVVLLTWYYVPAWTRGHRDFARKRYLRAFEDERILNFLDRREVATVNFYGQLLVSVALGPAALAFWLARIGPYILLSGYVNAVGHTYGARPYANQGTDARGVLQTLLGYLVGGETLGHNYHHRHPTSATFRPHGRDPGFAFATAIMCGIPLHRRAGGPTRAARPENSPAPSPTSRIAGPLAPRV